MFKSLVDVGYFLLVFVCVMCMGMLIVGMVILLVV